MIPFPFQAGQLGVGGMSSADMFLRSSGTMALQTSATSINVATPAGMSVGDFMVAVIMTRTTPGSAPAGWTLLVLGTEVTNGSANQRASAYWKFATSTDVAGTNHTFTQAVAGRMMGEIVAFGSSVGQFPGGVLWDVQETGVSSTAATSINLPVIVSARPAAIALGFASSMVANTSPATTTYTVSAGWTGASPATQVDNRMYIVSRKVSFGGNTSATISNDATGTTGWTASTILMWAP